MGTASPVNCKGFCLEAPSGSPCRMYCLPWGWSPRLVDCFGDGFLRGQGSSLSFSRDVSLLPVIWIYLVGPVNLPLAAELRAGRANAAGAAGRGWGLPKEVFSGHEADEGGCLVSRREACYHMPPSAGKCVAIEGPGQLWLGRSCLHLL